MSNLNFLAITDMICALLEVLKHVFSLHSSQNIGHSDLIAGIQGALPRTSLTVQFKVSRSYGYDLCPVNRHNAVSKIEKKMHEN